MSAADRVPVPLMKSDDRAPDETLQIEPLHRKPPQRATQMRQPIDARLTVDDVATRLNVSRDWVWDHSSRKTPRLPVIRMGDGTLRYRAAAIEAFISERERLSASTVQADKMNVPTVLPHRISRNQWVNRIRRGHSFFAASAGTPITAEGSLTPQPNTVRVVRVVLRLDLKSQMTKLAAREVLRTQIAKQTRKIADGRTLRCGGATFEWFVRNRYLPLRQGDWRPETAKEKTAQIEIDPIQKFGAESMESIDKFALQTHVNDLAKRYSQDRVKQARSYLKSIFDEAMEQEFLVNDSTRKLKFQNLRPKDKLVLTWDQLRAVLATAARRDSLLLILI